MTGVENDPPFVGDFLSPYDVESRHEIFVTAPDRFVYEAVRRLDLSGSWIIRTLFRLRGMPNSALNADGLAKIRFKPLFEDPPRGMVLGIVGQFWHPSGRLLDFDPESFAGLEAPGYARAIWSFDITTTPDGSRLRTITRVACSDEATRRRFTHYWRLVGPFSGIIRREALKTVKRDAEARSLASME